MSKSRSATPSARHKRPTNCSPNWNTSCNYSPRRPGRPRYNTADSSARHGRLSRFPFFVAEANAKVRNLGFAGVFQIADLHPQYEFAGSDADDIDNFSNRAPYPTLHLLREASIDRAVAAFPDAAEIFERNIETLQELGHEGWRQLWLDAPEKTKTGEK